MNAKSEKNGESRLEPQETLHFRSVNKDYLRDGEKNTAKRDDFMRPCWKGKEKRKNKEI